MQRIYITDPQQWDDILSQLSPAQPYAVPFLQTWEWGELKSRWGWRAVRLAWQSPLGWLGACQVLTRHEGRFGLRIQAHYAPRGPVLDWQNQALGRAILQDLQAWAKQQGGLFLKIDPEIILAVRAPGAEEDNPNLNGVEWQNWFGAQGWQYSTGQIQFRNTVMLDLTPPADVLLANLKQKTRYNVRLAERKGVQVRTAQPAELPQLFALYAETAQRDGFLIRPSAYYLDVWQTYLAAGKGLALLATVEGKLVAGLFLAFSNGRATYYNGMSGAEYREWMPTYLLQWQAILAAQQAGMRTYDFWGAPEAFDESDSLWGVWRFKEGFRGLFVRTLGAWDLPISPWLFGIYQRLRVK